MYNFKSKYFLQIKVKFAQLKVSLEQLSRRCTGVYIYMLLLFFLHLHTVRWIYLFYVIHVTWEKKRNSIGLITAPEWSKDKSNTTHNVHCIHVTLFTWLPKIIYITTVSVMTANFFQLGTSLLFTSGRKILVHSHLQSATELLTHSPF